MDWMYAYNYWRTVFLSESEDNFAKEDFDKWFRSGTEHPVDGLQHFATKAEAGSQEQFDDAVRTSFIRLLEACADGRFGKPAPRRRGE